MSTGMPTFISDCIGLQRDGERGVVEDTAKVLPLATAISANESALDASLTLGPANTAEGEVNVEILSMPLPL